MELGRRARTEKKSVAPGAALIALIALCAFVGAVAFLNLRPRVVYEKAPNKSATTLWIEQKAAESGGDITKLSSEDQQKLQNISRGRGEQMLRTLAPKK